MNTHLYITASELGFSLADVKGYVKKDFDHGRIMGIEPAPSNTSIMVGGKRMWNHDQLDFWIVHIIDSDI